MAICSPDDPVTWSVLQGLMQSIVATAQELGVTVDDPTQDPASVWSRDSTYQMPVLAMTFNLAQDGVVESAHLSPALGDASAWDFPAPFMQTLEDSGSLVFLSDQDGCWCKTMWLVEPCSAGHTLKETSGSQYGCCQTLPVPAAGSSLLADQPWIPPRFVRGKTGQDQADPDLPIVESTREKCRAEAGGIMLRQQGGVLLSAQRELAGVITWVIKPEHMQDLYDKLSEIAEGAGGPKAGKVRKASADFPEAPDMCEGARVSMADILYTLRKRGDVSELDEPGCLELLDGQCVPKLPWHQLTCGAQNCDGSIKLYCNSLELLDKIRQELPDLLHPASRAVECAEGSITTGSTRTGGLVQCTPDFVLDGPSPVFTHYEEGDDLPPGVVILHDSFKVDSCDSCLCLDAPLYGNCIARVSAMYYRVFGAYLLDAWRDGAYETWRARAASTNKLHCQAYWDVRNSYFPPFSGFPTAPGVAVSYFHEREPVRPYPVKIDYGDGPVRHLCIPYAGPMADSPPYDGPDYWTVQSAGTLDPCGTSLKGAGVESGGMTEAAMGYKGSNAAILMGWQLVAADVDMVPPFAAGDYETSHGCADSGFAESGSAVAYDSGWPVPIQHTLPGIGFSYRFTGISIRCLCPSAVESGAEIYEIMAGGTEQCADNLFSHECG